MHSHHQFYTSNKNHISNATLTSKSFGIHHGSVPLKKTDAPMLNLVYDSHIKQRHPDFRWAEFHFYAIFFFQSMLS